MKTRLMIACIAALTFASPAIAAPTTNKSAIPTAPAASAPSTPLTVLHALNMLQALQALDSHPTPATKTPDGKDVPASNQGWSFGSGSLRLKIAKNMAALQRIQTEAEQSRLAIVRELIAKAEPDKDGKKPTEIDPKSPQWAELSKQFNEVMESPAQVSLFRIKASELKLDQNDIPVLVLASLMPIIDDDITPKE